MGLFGSDKKTSVRETYEEAIGSYNVTVDESQSSSSIMETTTGLMGEHAIELMTVMEAGQTDRAALVGQTLQAIYQDVGDVYNHLVGGANALIIASDKATERGIAQQGIIASSMDDLYREAAVTTRSIQGVEESTIEKVAPFIMAGLLIMIIFWK